LSVLWIAAKSDDNKLPQSCKRLRIIVDCYYYYYEKYYKDGYQLGLGLGRKASYLQSDEVCSLYI